MVDEGDPEGGVACGIDTGECAMGITRCDTARGRVVCDGEVRPTTEICNGLDDNCDGTVDEGNPDGGRVCGRARASARSATSSASTARSSAWAK
ncbi:MAG: hypothetical protein M5U28_54290 [Sandaracinaceae bacterium]|nr:hypothetical protein [Sandaracinaceae bacterium]